jgi:hypothetical protein
MTPLLMYAAFAGGLGWGIHKQKWGVAAFFGAMLVWMIIVQLAAALMSGGHTASF